ncbi:hypothetical protein [Methyloceanibacter caenitepidi]|uniref:Uncharacterized protein n=1 Tax=Methyloceanibacter caenitepidi TaxID=1384459 RepID=A0A0A8K5A3_9HYPH|nr:hypothetical protein [Methyloceanibacter caenitepidi]BAQ17936.1 hypothetical protein GL4_2502 [Methyloceanibacter caenitepidi]
MTVFTKTAAFAALAVPLLFTGAANAGDCGEDPVCSEYAPPSLEQVLVHEARRGLKKLDLYLEQRYGDDTPIGPLLRGKRH